MRAASAEHLFFVIPHMEVVICGDVFETLTSFDSFPVLRRLSFAADRHVFFASRTHFTDTHSVVPRPNTLIIAINR